MSMSESDKELVERFREESKNCPIRKRGEDCPPCNREMALISILDRREAEIKRLREGIRGLRMERVVPLFYSDDAYNKAVNEVNAKVDALLGKE